MIHASAVNTPDVPNLSTPEIHLELDNYITDHDLHTNQIKILTPLNSSYTYPYSGPPSARQMHGKCTRVLTSQCAQNHHISGCRPMGNPIEGPPRQKLRLLHPARN